MRILTSILSILFLTSFGLLENIDDYQTRIKVFDEYPVPTDENMLFYIQKSYNTNTVVYTANIDADGNINKKEPITVFWRRYQEQGQKRELKMMERTFGYGVNTKAIKDKLNTFKFTLVSLKDMEFVLTLDKKGKPQVATFINEIPSRIERVYVTAEHVSLVPKVFSVEVFGKEIKTKQPIYQKFNSNK